MDGKRAHVAEMNIAFLIELAIYSILSFRCRRPSK